MEKPIKILMLEDSEWDADLIQREIKKSGINFMVKVVNTQDDYINALKSFLPDVILSDHSLPGFSSTEAFNIYKNLGLSIPFILVTGTVSEEFAVASIKKGVDDYILKNNLIRLPSAILHSIKSKITELEKQKTQEELLKSEIQIRNFATHLNDVLEEERARIAREIHDELGQQLTGIKLSIAMCKKMYRLEKPTEDKINSVIDEIDMTINTLKNIATELRPAILDSFGLIPAIEWMSKEFEKKTGITCKIKNNVDELNPEKKISTTLFRICQETLNNIAKHSEAKNAQIEINKQKNQLTVEISDDGKGIDNKKIKKPMSMGLIGMHERAKIIGAQLYINSSEHSGTSIKIMVNLN